MKSYPSSTSNWNSSLLSIAGNRIPANLQKLYDNGINTLYDLLWIFPLRLHIIPQLKSFQHAIKDELFLGQAKVISKKITPAFGRRGKGNIQLFNVDLIIQDKLSDGIMTLKWFNAYPNIKKQLEHLKEFYFLGTISEFRGQIQVINPSLNPKEMQSTEQFLIEYPTVAGVSGNEIKKYIEKISNSVWETPLVSFLDSFENLNEPSLLEAFKAMHGRSSLLSKAEARNRIIYEEFFSNQIRVLARKLKNKNLKAKKIICTQDEMMTFKSYFPYELTLDQIRVLEEISNDFQSGHPMMRMVQGDVGCGKTSVAIIASLMASKNAYQVALMCPTETLARQHERTFQKILGSKIKIELLLGSSKAKEKKQIQKNIEAGSTNLVIGTHALIQESIQFKNLGLGIIDEQHKFGVKQRQKLIQKGEGVHTLIMTATPIPRSLQLAQYGDLDISTIKTIPAGRKGTKTRIVTKQTYDKYLSFIKTRIELGEQVYVVVPAIEESETLALNNVNEIESDYKKYFPNYSIATLHGQLKNEVKNQTMHDYMDGKIQILISTTVIEVGIDVANATVMSIYSPDRFGLSSLHQLRGRVGRSDKPGFCFLIADESTPKEAMTRLKVFENTNDGFEIAEADLKNRGQGELFGESQSGYNSDYQLANVFQHFPIFEKVSRDIEKLKLEQTEKLNNILLELSEDIKVSSTI